MKTEKDIRWTQRFNNYKKALLTLKSAIDLSYKRELSDLEKQGMIQGFEFTHELCWKTIKDFINEKGNQNIYGSKDATREAFNLGLISNGENWMEMIESRNQSSHTYNIEVADEIVKKIISDYIQRFKEFEDTMDKFLIKL